MKFNRKEHSRFVQWLDRTAEKNPVLWLPCIFLLAVALGAEQICGAVRVAFTRREKIGVADGKADVQLVRKPFAFRVVAMALTITLLFTFVPDLSNIIGANVYAYVTNGEFTLDEWTDYYEVIMYKGFDDIVYVPSEANGKPVQYISGFDTYNGYVGAFQGTFVKKVILPNGIYGIYDSAFKNCNYLESVNIPDVWAAGKIGRGSIGPEAFMNCSSLSSISIPASIQQIYGHSSYNGGGVFENCTQLTSAIFPNEVDMLDNGYYIGSRCFAGCTSLKDINLPILKADNPECIGIMNNVFENCSSLEEISIPDGYKYINDEAFLNCSNLIKVIIPKSVTEISENAFIGCDKLTIYGYNNSYAETFANANGISFIALDESTTKNGKCGENAHWDLSDDGTLTISGYGDMYDYDFYEGTSVPNIPYFGDFSSALDNAKKIKNVVFSADSNITYIGRNAFGRTGITDFNIPTSVQSIGAEAFSGCENLTEITLPKTLSSLNYGCFLNCTSLKEITVLNSELGIGERALGYEAHTVGQNDATIYNDVVIYGYKNSTAETYATENGIVFIALDSTDENTIAFSNFAIDKYSVGTDSASPIIAHFTGKGEISENDISVFADDNSIIEITSTHINISNQNTDNQQTWVEIQVRGLTLGEVTNLNLTYNGLTYSVAVEVVAAINPQRFEIGRDNFSFINTADYFGDSYDISDESLLKLLNSTNENIVKANIIRNSKNNFSGSCNGMSKVASIMFIDKLRLPTHKLLGNDFYNIETAKLPAPKASYNIADVINYYQLSQFLPFEQNKKFDKNVVNPQNVIACLKNNNTPVCVSIQNYDSVKNEYKNGHMILLTDIIEENESYYTVKCYDSSLTNDKQGNLKIYKNSLYSDKISIDYKWEYPFVEWNVIIKVLSNIDEIDYVNYFSNNLVSYETYNENILILNNTARLYINMLVDLPSNVANLINDGFVNPNYSERIVGPINTDSLLPNETSISNSVYYIDKNISDDFKITIDENDEKSDVYFILDNYSFALTTNEALEFNVSDTLGSAQVTANNPSDFNLQLTSNDNFGGWKWFTVDVDVDDSTKFELAPTDEGIVVSGDNLSDITINANDEVDNTSIQFSTSEESVLIKNSNEDELEIYADIDDNGTYETLISDGSGVHTHSFGTDWKYDSTSHWHECSCGERAGSEEHSEDEGTVTVRPTETTEGIKTYSCAVCGYVMRTETFDNPHTHSFGTDWKSDSTSHWHECSCGEKADSEEHREDKGVVTVQPTETTEGVRTYSCEVCGYVMRTATIPPIDEPHIHSFSTDWKHDSSFHWHECSCGVKADSEEHREGEGVVTVQPTETTYGIKTYSCTVCGYVMRTEMFGNPHIHSFGTDWKFDSTHHWHECSCGERTDTALHTENSGVVTVQPTTTSTGTRIYSCTVCGYVTRTEIIPMITPPTIPIHPDPIIPSQPYPTPGTEILPPVLTVNKNIDVSVTSGLKDLAKGEARIKTKRRFFDASAEVYLSNTDEADAAGKRALERLDGNGLICYPFDISVYNVENGSKMQLAAGGYITFEIAVPKSMEATAASIEVYHIPGGVPEHIESEIITDKYDNLKIVFTASEFSPYMFTAVAGEDIASGAGVTAGSVSVDMTTPVSNGVGIPTAKLPRIMRFSGKKRRYRILRKRRLDDLVFVY